MKPNRKRKTKRDHRENSILHVQIQSAIEAPGGIAKVLHLVGEASDEEINKLNDAQYSPLVGCIFRLGKNTTRNGNSPQSQAQLLELIEMCYRRNLSPNAGAMFGACFHRPLIVAAYYGYYSAVRLLLQHGALPDLRDGDDKNVLYAAFLNPTGSNTLRECDKRVAEILWEMGAVTCDLREWRQMNLDTSLDSVCYSNSGSLRSVMYLSVNNKCLQAMKFMVDKGSVITDAVFLQMTKYKLLKRFLSMVACLNSSTAILHKPTNEALKQILSWNREIDWSFPPTWKVAVVLCGNCGLSDDIFHNNVVPFLARDWFFTKEQLQSAGILKRNR